MTPACFDRAGRGASVVMSASMVAIVAGVVIGFASAGCGDTTDASCSCPAKGHRASSAAGAKFAVVSGACTGQCTQSAGPVCHIFVVDGPDGSTCTISSTPEGGTATSFEVRFANTDCCGVQPTPRDARNP